MSIYLIGISLSRERQPEISKNHLTIVLLAFIIGQVSAVYRVHFSETIKEV